MSADMKKLAALALKEELTQDDIRFVLGNPEIRTDSIKRGWLQNGRYPTLAEMLAIARGRAYTGAGGCKGIVEMIPRVEKVLSLSETGQKKRKASDPERKLKAFKVDETAHGPALAEQLNQFYNWVSPGAKREIAREVPKALAGAKLDLSQCLSGRDDTVVAATPERVVSANFVYLRPEPPTGASAVHNATSVLQKCKVPAEWCLNLGTTADAIEGLDDLDAHGVLVLHGHFSAGRVNSEHGGIEIAALLAGRRFGAVICIGCGDATVADAAALHGVASVTCRGLVDSRIAFHFLAGTISALMQGGTLAAAVNDGIAKAAVLQAALPEVLPLDVDLRVRPPKRAATAEPETLSLRALQARPTCERYSFTACTRTVEVDVVPLMAALPWSKLKDLPLLPSWSMRDLKNFAAARPELLHISGTSKSALIAAMQGVFDEAARARQPGKVVLRTKLVFDKTDVHRCGETDRFLFIADGPKFAHRWLSESEALALPGPAVRGLQAVPFEELSEAQQEEGVVLLTELISGPEESTGKTEVESTRSTYVASVTRTAAKAALAVLDAEGQLLCVAACKVAHGVGTARGRRIRELAYIASSGRGGTPALQLLMAAVKDAGDEILLADSVDGHGDSLRNVFVEWSAPMNLAKVEEKAQEAAKYWRERCVVLPYKSLNKAALVCFDSEQAAWRFESAMGEMKSATAVIFTERLLKTRRWYKARGLNPLDDALHLQEVKLGKRLLNEDDFYALFPRTNPDLSSHAERETRAVFWCPA